MEPLLAADDIARLREALHRAGYTSDGIAERIGPAAVAAVRRNDFRALLRATPTGTRWPPWSGCSWAGRPSRSAAVAAALDPLPLETALRAGLVEHYGDGLHAGVDLDVYAGPTARTGGSSPTWTSTPGPARCGPTTCSASATRPPRWPRATVRHQGRQPRSTSAPGCGVQALQLSTHSATVTATDLSDRALRFAATTAALNGLSWELLAGDMLAPVAGRRFDLVVSNPPFVVGPGSTRYTYRDSGRAGDGVCAELAAAAPGLLTEGGTLQFLANWLHVAGEDWHDRVAGWVAGTGCDAWIVQREVSDPVEYVNLWLRDASEAFDPARAEAWLDWFDARQDRGRRLRPGHARAGPVGTPRWYGSRSCARPRLSARRAGAGLVRPAGLAGRAPGPAGHRVRAGRPGCG